MSYLMRLIQFTRCASEHNLTRLSNPIHLRTKSEVRADKRAWR